MSTDLEPYPLPGWLTNPDTPGAQPGPASMLDLGTRGMGRLDDTALEAVVTAMRDDARATYESYARWVRAIRARRVSAGRSEREAARASGVSRAAMRKATTAKR